MEVFEFNYGCDLIRARLRKSGSVYVDMTTRDVNFVVFIDYFFK